MTNLFTNLTEAAQKLGFTGSKEDLYSIRDWLREIHDIHIEVGSIWDEETNWVESYFYSVTAPIHVYHVEQQYCGGGKTFPEMLLQGVRTGLELLDQYNKQKHLQVEDDELVVAYLKGYSEKNSGKRKQPLYPTNIQEYAYRQGKQGDYIEEGLTDEDIVILVRNEMKEEEQLRLK